MIVIWQNLVLVSLWACGAAIVVLMLCALVVFVQSMWASRPDNWRRFRNDK